MAQGSRFRGSKVDRFKMVTSKISGIEKNREAINPEPLNSDRPNVQFLSDLL